MAQTNGSAHKPPTTEVPPVQISGETHLVAPTPAEFLRIAIDKNATVAELKELMVFYEQCEQNLARKAYFKSINQFKRVAPDILKNETVEFQSRPKDGKSAQTIIWDFATLDHICDHVIKKLSEFDITHRWAFEQPHPPNIRVGCILTHVLGHSETTWMERPPDNSGDKSPIHALYSTVSHLERYTLLSAVGLATKDNPELHKATSTIAGQVVSTNTSELDQQKAILHNAANEKELGTKFREFYSKASAAKNKVAQDELIKAKNKRLKELF